MLTRRSFVVAGGATVLFTGLGSRMAVARALTDRRFVFIIQRGAADGLGTLAPPRSPASAGRSRRTSRRAPSSTRCSPFTPQ